MMIKYTPIPVLFQIAGIKIYSHIFMIALALLVFYILARRELVDLRRKDKRMRLHLKHMDEILLWAVIGSFIGGRLGYIILNPLGFRNLLDVLKIWDGGMLIYPSILGGIIFAFAYAKAKNIDFFEVADLFAPYIALGFAIGRIGCFLNWDAYGKASEFPFAVWVNGVPYHPAQIYLVIGNLAIFLILTLIKRKASNFVKKRGNLFFLFLLFYAVLNFIVDFFRIYPKREFIAGLSLSHLTSILLLFISVSALILANGKRRYS